MMKLCNQKVSLSKYACRLLIFLIGMISLNSMASDPDTTIGGHKRSKVFYDSVYHKFSKTPFTKFLYRLAFVNPKSLVSISDTAQVKKSESPFKKYKGKVIRNISVITLDPFIYSIRDTLNIAKTGIGQALNNVHISTRNYVIRKNLQIKKGMRIDPNVMADNERFLRDLPYINEVLTIIEKVPESNDSVDVIIITKDVWSIGLDLITITSSLLRLRIYDANFLGTGNRLSTTFSMRPSGEPFFTLEALTYRYTNLMGSFIDVFGTITQEESGSHSYEIGAARGFYSNKTKWAGGIGYGYHKTVELHLDSPRVIAYYNNQSLWAGRAFFLEKENRPTRLVILGAMNRRSYTSRPPVSISKNREFYDVIQVLPGLAYSRNNFYISDYFVEFGRIENIPYGNLFQINFGREWTNFYNRFYYGFEFSGGNFFKKFGYIAASFKGGGYINHANSEDGVIKFSTRYITPSIYSPDHRYKFRTFFVSDFRLGFNERNNNKDLFNVNDNFKIEKVKNDTVLMGTKSLNFTLSSILFTPWYFYGFRFALLAQLQGGWIARTGNILLRQPFYTGTGLGIMTKNENLIFPTVIISLFYYPGKIPGVTTWQIRFLPDAALHLPDFNPSVPHVEGLQN